jgi:ATP-dependent Lhr-like helicase
LLVPIADTTPSEETLAPETMAAMTGQLLHRYGVVFRDLLAREVGLPPWRELLWCLRDQEARGEVRGGRFVSGYQGEQFALPEAIDAMRAARREAKPGERVRLSACDPLNLVGILTSDRRVPAVLGNHVVFVDGIYQPSGENVAMFFPSLGFPS